MLRDVARGEIKSLPFSLVQWASHHLSHSYDSKGEVGAIHLGQRPLGVLRVFCWLWASVRLQHLN